MGGGENLDSSNYLHTLTVKIVRNHQRVLPQQRTRFITRRSFSFQLSHDVLDFFVHMIAALRSILYRRQHPLLIVERELTVGLL